MLDLQRVTGWPERLITVVGDHRAQAFAWGKYDCATFFGDCVERITGLDLFAAYWPWRSEREAAEKLIASGYRDMEHFTASLLPAIAPAMARRGDVGFPAGRPRLSCPYVIMGAEAMSRDERDWLVVPTALLATTYRVG